MHHRLHDKGGSAARGSTSGVRSASGGFAYRRGFLYPRGLGRPPPRDTWVTTEYGPQAFGTHPTGMLSFVKQWLLSFTKPPKQNIFRKNTTAHNFAETLYP